MSTKCNRRCKEKNKKIILGDFGDVSKNHPNKKFDYNFLLDYNWIIKFFGEGLAMRTRKIVFALLLAIIRWICASCTFDSSFAGSQTADSDCDVIIQNMLLETEETTVTHLTEASLMTTKDSQNYVMTTQNSSTTYTETKATTELEISTIEITTTDAGTKTESISIVETAEEDVITDVIVTEDLQDDKQNDNVQDTNVKSSQETTKDNIIEVDETTETTYVNPTEQIQDEIIIGDRTIEIVYGPANQENIDKYDVVQDTEYWSNDSSKYFYGHNYRSFSCLKKINVGETITLINDGCAIEYVVTRSEKGIITNNNTDIKSCVDDTMLITTRFEHDNIRLITCVDVFSPTYRWVVIAEKNE